MHQVYSYSSYYPYYSSTYNPYHSSYYSPYYSSYYSPYYSYTSPYYSYYRSTPSSIYLPSAVPFRYYSRSTPVRVITSALKDYTPPRIFSVNVRPSVIHRELLRIEHKSRPHYGFSAVDEFLNSKHAKVSCLLLCYSVSLNPLLKTWCSFCFFLRSHPY